VNDSTVRAEITKPDSTTININLTNQGDGTYNASYSNTSLEGNYNIRVIANGTVNNTQYNREADALVEVRSLPDFEINKSDIIFSNSTPTAGDNITINATVWNVGDAEANVTIELYDNTSLINDTSAVIGAGGNTTFSTFWEIPTSGNHTIKVKVDPTYAVDEKNETNNNANKSLNVTPAMKLRIICSTDCIECEENQDVNITCSLYNFDWDRISGDIVVADVNGTQVNLTESQNVTGRYSGLFSNTSKLGVYEVNVSAAKASYTNATGYWAFEVVQAGAICSGSEPVFSLDWNITQYTVCEDTNIFLEQNKTVNFFNETLILNNTEVNLNTSRIDFGENGVLIMDNSTIFFM